MKKTLLSFAVLAFAASAFAAPFEQDAKEAADQAAADSRRFQRSVASVLAQSQREIYDFKEEKQRIQELKDAFSKGQAPKDLVGSWRLVLDAGGGTSPEYAAEGLGRRMDAESLSFAGGAVVASAQNFQKDTAAIPVGGKRGSAIFKLEFDIKQAFLVPIFHFTRDYECRLVRPDELLCLVNTKLDEPWFLGYRLRIEKASAAPGALRMYLASNASEAGRCDSREGFSCTKYGYCYGCGYAYQLCPNGKFGYCYSCGYGYHQCTGRIDCSGQCQVH